MTLHEAQAMLARGIISDEAIRRITYAIKDGYQLEKKTAKPDTIDGPETEIDTEFGKKLAPCPFCGQHLIFMANSCIIDDDTKITVQYFRHPDTNKCLLHELCPGFALPAGNADRETGNIGEHAEEWNTALQS